MVSVSVSIQPDKLLRRRFCLQRAGAQEKGNLGPEEQGSLLTGQHWTARLEFCQLGNCRERTPGGGNCMCRGTEVCFVTSEKFQGAPGEITESTEQRPTSYTNELIYTTETDSQT